MTDFININHNIIIIVEHLTTGHIQFSQVFYDNLIEQSRLFFSQINQNTFL